MSKLIRRWLTDDRLRCEFGGRYVGEIDGVELQVVHHKFRGVKVTEPTIRFADDVLLVPNMKMRAALIELFGPETDDWIGQRVAIRRQCIVHVDRKTGEEKVRFEKRAEHPDAESQRSPFERETFTSSDDDEQDTDPIRFPRGRLRAALKQELDDTDWSAPLPPVETDLRERRRRELESPSARSTSARRCPTSRRCRWSSGCSNGAGRCRNAIRGKRWDSGRCRCWRGGWKN